MSGDGFWSRIRNREQKRTVHEQSEERDVSDLEEKRGEFTYYGLAAEYACQYIYTHAKNETNPEKLVIFPESYYATQDENGNVYLNYEKRNTFKLVSNVGAYEELSDRLVRAGYATLRCVRNAKTYKALLKKDFDEQLTGPEYGKMFFEILRREGFEERICLLLHGRANQAMSELVKAMPVEAVVSLCGAGMGFREEYIRFHIWNGMSPDKAWKKYEKLRRKVCKTAHLDPDSYVSPVDSTTEGGSERFVKLAAQLPVFVGYAEEDPFYDGKIAEEIRDYGMDNIHVVKFEDTDFTFRRRRHNTRVTQGGWELENGEHLNKMNPVVADEIIAWLDKWF